MGWRILNGRSTWVIHLPTCRIPIPCLSINECYEVSLSCVLPFLCTVICVERDSLCQRWIQKCSAVRNSSEFKGVLTLSSFAQTLWMNRSIHTVTQFRRVKEDTLVSKEGSLMETEDNSGSMQCSSASTGIDITTGFVGQFDRRFGSHRGPCHHKS